MATGKTKGRPSRAKSERSQISLRFADETINRLDELVEKQNELIQERALFSIEVNRNVLIEYLIQAEHKRMQYALENEGYPMPFILNPFNPILPHGEAQEPHVKTSSNSISDVNDEGNNEAELNVEVNELDSTTNE